MVFLRYREYNGTESFPVIVHLDYSACVLRIEQAIGYSGDIS